MVAVLRGSHSSCGCIRCVHPRETWQDGLIDKTMARAGGGWREGMKGIMKGSSLLSLLPHVGVGETS